MAKSDGIIEKKSFHDRMPFDRQLTTGVVQLLRIHKVLSVLQKGFRSLYVFLCSTSKINSCSSIYTNTATCLYSISVKTTNKRWSKANACFRFVNDDTYVEFYKYTSCTLSPCFLGTEKYLVTVCLFLKD